MTIKGMEMKLTNQEKKELDKFTKFLALKSTQVIIQSRLGEKVSTPSKPYTSGTDWFNLNITDLSDVLDEARNVLSLNPEPSRLPLCVDISLKTPEGDSMFLETWCLGLLPEQCDPSIRIVHTVYNRMGILLKSLVSVTRVTPAYKMARMQGPDSYVMCYKIYKGQPETHLLGEDFKQVRIGQICTPIGTLHLSVYYRTKMTISPTKTGKDNSIMVKSDHFNTNLSPRSKRYNHGDEKTSAFSDTMKIGAFAEYRQKEIDEPRLIIPEAPFSKLFAEKISPDRMSQDSESLINAINDSKTASAEETDRMERAKTPEKVEKEKVSNGNPPSPPIESPLDALKVRLGCFTMVSDNDDFIMKAHFASTAALESCTLHNMHDEWEDAPPLETFVGGEPPAEENENLSEQIETYETDVNEIDSVVETISQSPNNN